MNVENNCERYLVVGRKAVLHTDAKHDDSPRHKTTIRGWEKGTLVILDIPMQHGAPLMMRKNQDCVVRFMHEGQACGFDARVLSSGSLVQPHFEITWPETIQVMALRRYERVEVRIHCTIFLSGGKSHEGRIADISVGGCGVITDTLLSPNSEVYFDFTLPNGMKFELVPALVSSARPVGKNYFLGCSFVDCPEDAQDDIHFFVGTVLERKRALDSSRHRIIVVDPVSQTAAPFSKEFGAQGYESTIVPGVVDAFHQLRLGAPEALLVRHPNTELDVKEICRILKQTRGCESLPVFICGGNDASYEETALGAGAAGYFTDDKAPEEVVGKILKYISE